MDGQAISHHAPEELRKKTQFGLARADAFDWGLLKRAIEFNHLESRVELGKVTHPCIAIKGKKKFREGTLVAGFPLGKTFLLFPSNRAQSVGIFSPGAGQNVSRFDL
jgi:hypothetical protein